MGCGVGGVQDGEGLGSCCCGGVGALIFGFDLSGGVGGGGVGFEFVVVR